jgi:hypothetical protein
MVIELTEEELPVIIEANQLFEIPEELPMASIQQPVQMLTITKSTTTPFKCFRIHFITCRLI